MKRSRLKYVITLLLFAAWVLFNQGKMTALGIFGGKPGYMFTDATSVDILGGLFVHGVLFCVCAGVGFAISAVVNRVLK